MNDLQPRAAWAENAKGALYLQFRIRAQRFALSVHEVIEVLPRQPLKPIAQAPAWVAGILAHRGQLVPVIDLAALSFGQPAVQRMDRDWRAHRGWQLLAKVEGRHRAAITLCVPDETGREIDLALPTPYPVTPQIKGAIKAMAGVVLVEEV